MYYYIFEDGTILKSPHPPTESDLHAVDEGILQVIDTRTHLILTEDGNEEIPYCPVIEDPFFKKKYHANLDEEEI
jgi:hypothetical protein